MPDRTVTTWLSKQAEFHKPVMLELTVEEEDVIVCLSPRARWYLLSVSAMYGEFANRFKEWDPGEALEMVHDAEASLIMTLGCQSDLTRIADALEAMLALMVDQSLVLNQLTRLADATEAQGAEFTGIGAIIGGAGVDEGLIDQIEEILDGVCTILGAAAVLP